MFRKRNCNTNCVRFFFVHFKTPFDVCNRSSLFSALFGHTVGNEYANVRRDGDVDHVSMYTPFHACRHRQEATCCLPHMLEAPTIHHTHTHHRRNKHNRCDDSRFIRQSMNRSERQTSFFSEMIYYIINQLDYCQSRFKYFSKIINVTSQSHLVYQFENDSLFLKFKFFINTEIFDLTVALLRNIANI